MLLGQLAQQWIIRVLFRTITLATSKTNRYIGLIISKTLIYLKSTEMIPNYTMLFKHLWVLKIIPGTIILEGKMNYLVGKVTVTNQVLVLEPLARKLHLPATIFQIKITTRWTPISYSTVKMTRCLASLTIIKLHQNFNANRIKAGEGRLLLPLKSKFLN